MNESPRLKWFGLLISSISSVLLLIHAIAPGSREESGLSFVLFFARAMRFELLGLLSVGLLFLWVARRRDPMGSVRRSLVRREWSGWPEFAKINGLSLGLLLFAFLFMAEPARELYYAAKFRYRYLMNLVDADYALEPLRRADLHVRMHQYREALKHFESMSGSMRASSRRQYQRAKVAVDYSARLVAEAKKLETAGRPTRSAVAARIEAMRFAPLDNENREALRQDHAQLKMGFVQAAKLGEACKDGSAEVVMAIVDQSSWLLFDPWVEDDLRRGPFGEPGDVVASDWCKLIEGRTPEQLIAEMERSWHTRLLEEVLGPRND